MKRTIALVFAGFIGAFCSTALATETEGDLIFPMETPADLNEFLWKNRLVVVFADSPDDPAFIQQMELLQERRDALAVRDVVVLADSDPKTRGPLRRKFRPRGFMLVLVGKDGGVKLRKPFPWDVRELSRSIDKMPLRQREIRAQSEASDG